MKLCNKFVEKIYNKVYPEISYNWIIHSEYGVMPFKQPSWIIVQVPEADMKLESSKIVSSQKVA